MSDDAVFEKIFGKGFASQNATVAARRDFEDGFARCQREASILLREHGHALAAERVERMKLTRKARS